MKMLALMLILLACAYPLALALGPLTYEIEPICPQLDPRLADDELVNATIDQVVVFDLPTRGFDSTGEIYQIDSFPTREAFLRRFPDCCEVYKGIPADLFTPISWWERFTGRANSVVKLQYRETVRHRDGGIEDRPVLRYEVLDSCGKVVTSRRD